MDEIECTHGELETKNDGEKVWEGDRGDNNTMKASFHVLLLRGAGAGSFFCSHLCLNIGTLATLIPKKKTPPILKNLFLLNQVNVKKGKKKQIVESPR